MARKLPRQLETDEGMLVAFSILKQKIQLTAAGGSSRLLFTMATSMTVQSKDDLQRVELGFRSGVHEFLIACHRLEWARA